MPATKLGRRMLLVLEKWRIPTDHTARTYEEIYQMAANLQPHEAERTGEYVRMVAAPNTMKWAGNCWQGSSWAVWNIYSTTIRDLTMCCRHFTFAKLTLSRVTARRTTS